MSLQVKAAYEFGPFRLDPAAHLLLRAGEAIPLPPKAFDTLLVLVRQRGNLLAKEELLNAVWPDSFVEENNLNQYISMLRKALCEDGAGPKYIETIPRLGYRFVAEVNEVEAEDGKSAAARPSSQVQAQVQVQDSHASAPDLPHHASLSHHKRSAAPSVMLFGVISVLLVVAGIYRFYWANPPAVSATTRTLAVLPLRNLKPDPETDFLGVALTDAIINRLGSVNELTVEPLLSVVKYRNADADPRQIARELNVQSVLTGSYVKEGDAMRITTELISADKGGNPSRDSIELKYEKLMSVQDRVAASVIHSMGLELQPEELDRLRKGLPADPVAYEYYLRGFDASFHSDFQGAMKLLEKSVSLEPGNATAWAELGSVYLAFARVQGGGAGYADKGWEAFRRAIALDPGNPLIVDVMALHLIENNRAGEAITALRKSLGHNPHDSFAHLYLSEAYRYGGALDQSVAEGELALKLNPNAGQNLLLAYIYVGQYKKFLESLPPDETNARNVFYRGLAYYYLQDLRRAAAEFDRAFALNPDLLHAQMGRALTYAMAPRQAQGLDLMRKVERADSADGEMVYKMAQVYAQLGDKQSSLRLLRKSVELNFYPYPYFVHDPLLESVRSEPEYSAVMDLARQRQEAFLKRFF
jgi:DNA-binding winged helix-turn-helix (wHTH) protein/TolB-like protein/Flp pilus assembly protein TadD